MILKMILLNVCYIYEFLKVSTDKIIAFLIIGAQNPLLTMNFPLKNFQAIHVMLPEQNNSTVTRRLQKEHKESYYTL
jgi:hypothetical protein